MAGRFSVEGEFRVIDRMTRPIRRIQRGMRRFRTASERDMASIRQFAGHLRTAFVAVGVAVAAMGAAAAAALADVIETGVAFEQSIVNASARFGPAAARGTQAFTDLETAARDVGATTEFMASQAAEGLFHLAGAGFSAEQAIAALPAVVDLATASQVDLEEATRMASQSLGALNLMTEDSVQLGTNLARVNDVLARTANTSNTNVSQMFEAMRVGGPVATAAGASIETFGSLVAALGDAGITGSDAGTAIRNVFGRLVNPSRQASRALRGLGVDVEDADGNMRDIVDIMGDVNEGLEGMGTRTRGRVLGQIFGARTVASANIILNRGTEELNAYRTALEDAGGASADMAEVMRDTTGGDLATLTSTIEAFKLMIWDTVRGPMRQIVSAMTDWVRANSAWMSSGFQTAMEWMRDHSEEIADVLMRVAIVVGIVVGAVVGFFGAILALSFGIFGVVGGLIGALLVGLTWVVEWLWETGKGIYNAVSSFFSELWGAIAPYIMPVVDVLIGLFLMLAEVAGPVFESIGEMFTDLVDYLSRGFTWWWNLAVSVIAGIREAFAPLITWLSGVWGEVASFGQKHFGFLAVIAAGAAVAIMGPFAPLVLFFASIWDSIAAGFHATVGPILDAVGGFFADAQSRGHAARTGQSGADGADGSTPQVTGPQERAVALGGGSTTAEVGIAVRAEPGSSATVDPQPRGSRTQVTQTGVDD